MKASKNRIIYFHIGYWILLVGLFTCIWGTYDGNFQRNFFVQLWSLPARLFATYFSLRILIPHFFRKGRFTTFSFLFIAVILCAVLFVQRPIIIFIVEGVYLPYNSDDYFNLIALVNTGIDVSLGVIPLLYFHYILTQRVTQKEPHEMEAETTSFLVLKEGHVTRRIPLDHILFIESQKNLLVTKTETDEIKTYGNMKSVKEKLPEDRFIQTHRSYIVNIDKVGHYSSKSLNITGQDLPIGRNYKQQVNETLSSRFDN